jgi:hypothetical protein
MKVMELLVENDDFQRKYHLHRAFKEKHATEIGDKSFHGDGYPFTDAYYMSDEEWLEDDKITTRIETHMHQFVKWLVDSFKLDPYNIAMRLCVMVNGTYKLEIGLPGKKYQGEDNLTIKLLLKHLPAKLKQLVPEIKLEGDLYVHRTQKKITIHGMIAPTSDHYDELRNRCVFGRYDYNPEALTQDRFKQFKKHKSEQYGELMLRKAIKAGEIEDR